MQQYIIIYVTQIVNLREYLIFVAYIYWGCLDSCCRVNVCHLCRGCIKALQCDNTLAENFKTSCHKVIIEQCYINCHCP